MSTAEPAAFTEIVALVQSLAPEAVDRRAEPRARRDEEEGRRFLSDVLRHARTPEMSFDVDLFVIGAGSGGVRAARIAAGYGARVDGRRGVPHRRHLRHPRLRAQEAAGLRQPLRRRFRDAAGYGWRVGETSFDWPTMVAAKEKEITRLSGIYRSQSRKAPASRSSRSAPRSPARNRCALAERAASSARKHILIATGAAPELAPAVRRPRTRDLLERNLRSARRFPIACWSSAAAISRVEFASIFARLGASGDAGHARRQYSARLRRGHARRPARRDGPCRRDVRLRAPADAHREARRRAACGVVERRGSIVVDQVLIATGRAPNTRGLGLEAVGVALDERRRGQGRRLVGDQRAIDSRGRRRHQPHQSDAGRDPRGPRLRRSCVRRQADAVDHEYVPTRGVRDAGNRRRRLDRSARRASVTTSSTSTRELPPDEGDAVGPARTDDHEARRRRRRRDRVLGAHILGHEAGEMIQLLGDRGEDEGDQGRSRRDDGGPSDRRRGTRDDAHAHGPITSANQA